MPHHNQYGDPLTDADKAVIIALCNNDLNTQRAAKESHYHENSIRYRARQIKTKTGLDCRNFFDAVQLLEIALGDQSPVKYIKEKRDYET